MNDPSSATPLPPTERADEEPRKWWQTLWHRLRNLWHETPDAEALREVVEEIIDEPLSESGLSPAERMLLGNIMDLRGKKVGDCMIQRADIIAADVEADLRDLVDIMAAHAHSRIPIYRDTLDDVIGMVHIKDILPCLAYAQERSIADLIRPVMFVAPSMAAARLLLQMRQTRQHMAMVVDEFGGIDGMVTIEDLVEEIVGEIEDEHDAPPPPSIIKRADGTLLIDARLPIAEFEARTAIRLPLLEGEDIDTLGGYVANLAGRVPNIGEKVTGDGLGFEVLEMDQGRIRRLRVRALPRASEASPEPADKARAGSGAGI
jgi:CBS domain containing-hemolysin-like protein